MRDSNGYQNRSQRRHEARIRRARRNRNITIVIISAVLVLACMGVGAWFIIKNANGNNDGLTKVYKVTIPEGYTNKQTAEKVEKDSQGIITADEFEKAVADGVYSYSFLEGTGGNLEGFLFPKQYDITEQVSSYNLVNKMLSQFGEETSGLEWSKAAANGVTEYQVIIIASIVEKEAKVPEDRPVIASVIYNRLRAGMKLQLCSTVQYALGEWKPSLSYSDLEVDSPYNTYKVSGLPPAPICNPGFESISASLNPSSTDYLYFILTSSDGHHSFTSDYDQFLKWKNEHGL